MPSSLHMASTCSARFQKLTEQYASAPPSDLAISMMMAAFAFWAANSAPLAPNEFRALAAIVMALPLAIMARSITLPLTINAFEFGNSFTMFGGRPTDRAFSKSALEIPE